MKNFIWIVDDEWPDYAIENSVFSKNAEEYEVKYSKNDDFSKDLESFGKNAEALLCQISVPVTGEVINQLNRCKVISNYGTGYNNIDVEAARGKGIPVAYVPGYCAADIAEYVIGAICHYHRTPAGYTEKIKTGIWGAQAIDKPVHRLSAKKLFVIGMGSIGREVAAKASCLGLKVIAWSPSLTDSEAARLGVQRAGLEEGLSTADFISVHIKFNKDTYKFLKYEHFCKMKKNACFINTARGGVIDQKGLLRAIEEGRLSGAMLDVLEQEPPDPQDEILGCEKITVTPHISYYSEEAFQQLKFRAAMNVVKVLKSEPGADLV